MIALRNHTARSMRAKVVTEKWNLRMKDKYLDRW